MVAIALYDLKILKWSTTDQEFLSKLLTIIQFKNIVDKENNLHIFKSN